MSKFRERLIRAVFELERGLGWAEELEPRFKAHGVDAPAMEGFREQWNQYMQTRDWDWWKDHAQRYSTSELEDMRIDCIKRLDALGMVHGEPNRPTNGKEQFQQILHGTLNQEEKPQERVHDQEREM